MVRRILFTILLPFIGLAYTVGSQGMSVHYMVPITFAGAVGFLSCLAIAECIGLIMETFDTSDLQPGANSRHRASSMAESVKRRRTNYSSYPRVTSGIFVAQSIGFLLAAAATGIGGAMTRDIGAQSATGVTAGILLFITFCFIGATVRWKKVAVIPDEAFGTRRNTATEKRWEAEDFKPVIIGSPSGKVRRMNVLELGGMTRWTEIRILNKLIKGRDRTAFS